MGFRVRPRAAVVLAVSLLSFFPLSCFLHASLAATPDDAADAPPLGVTAPPVPAQGVALPSWLELGLDAVVRLEGARAFDLEAQALARETRASRALTRLRPRVTVRAGDRLALEVQPQWYGSHDLEAGRLSLYRAVAAYTSAALDLHVGRQEFAFGSAFLLGADDFFDGLAYDGARVTLRGGATLTLDVFGGRYAAAQSGGVSGSLTGAWAAWGAQGRPRVEAYAALDRGALPGESVRVLSLGARVAAPLGPHVTFEVEPIVQRGSYAPEPGGAFDVDAYGGHADLMAELGPLSLTAGYALGSAGDAAARAGGRWTEFRNPGHDVSQVGDLGLIGDLGGIDAGDARASGLRIVTLGGALPIRSATVSLTLHRVTAGAVQGVRSDDVGTELDAVLSFPLGERLAVTLAVSRFQGGAFYREATQDAPRLTYAHAGLRMTY